MVKKIWPQMPVKVNTSIIIGTISICWLFAKILTFKLWLTNRLFPIVPPLEWLHAPAFVHWALYISSIFLLLAIFILPNKKILYAALLVTEICSCVLDQNRWQPWEYQYLFTLFILLVNKKENVLEVYIFLISLIYIYSGLNKFNPNFLWLVWDNMMLQGFFKLSIAQAHQTMLYHSGYILALIECSCGIAFLFLPSRKIAGYFLIVMHLFILLVVGPFGLGYNKVIWPWNVLMILHVFFIITQKKQITLSIKNLAQGWNKLVIVCWAILPIFSIWGLWDHYLSSNLYSGTLPKAVICIADTSKTTNLKKYYNKADLLHKCNGKVLINLQTWSMMEMEAPVYPQMRVYKKIELDFYKKYPLANATFVYY
jgi:hypothetical protein